MSRILLGLVVLGFNVAVQDVHAFDVLNTRLVNDKAGERCSGRLEVRHGHHWGTVCERGWDVWDASVVCRELDCGFVLDIPSGIRYGRASGEVLWRDVKCSGDEFALDLCERSLNEHVCTHSQDAGVECTEVDPVMSPVVISLLVSGLTFVVATCAILIAAKVYCKRVRKPTELERESRTCVDNTYIALTVK